MDIIDRSCLFAVLILSLVSLPKPGAAAEETSAKESKPSSSAAEPETSSQRLWFRLVNVDIPPDSPHRISERLNHPPTIYVIVEKNGEQLGGPSVAKTGWSVDFPAKEQNMWPIQLGTDDRYSIELWDDQYFDDQILKITGLSGEDFRKIIYEPSGQLQDKARLTKIRFQLTTKPEGRK